MAEHPVIMENKQLKVFVNTPGSGTATNIKHKESVVSTAPKISDGKPTVAQKLSKYAFGEEVTEPGKYVWKSYLEPTGKRVANDIVEYFLVTLKNAFQRFLWGKTLNNNGNWVDRTSYSNWGRQQEPIKAMVTMNPVKELTFATRADAERVLNELKNTIANEGEGSVTVRQYYESSGCPQLCESGISSKSGWTNLSKAEIKDQPNGEGFVINLPRPVDLTAR